MALMIGVVAMLGHAATIQPTHTILSLDYSNTDTTVGKTSQVNSLPFGASDFQTVGGGDVFYIFLVVNPGTMTFTATPAVGSGFDVALYLSNGNAIDNTGLGTGVFIGSDVGIEGDPDTFTIANLDPGTYYIGVDSFYSSGAIDSPNRHQGEYTLTVSGTAVLGDPFAPVPEPASWLTIGAGFVAIGLNRWRRG
ncbi:MAG: PEP-CTERM sorting domain-containing protein [Acidobacteria bacterium]|nr:PEP-CTERM sorting domain-containing protein [Acidobacteriota bacterium]